MVGSGGSKGFFQPRTHNSKGLLFGLARFQVTNSRESIGRWLGMSTPMAAASCAVRQEKQHELSLSDASFREQLLDMHAHPHPPFEHTS